MEFFVFEFGTFFSQSRSLEPEVIFKDGRNLENSFDTFLRSRAILFNQVDHASHLSHRFQEIYWCSWRSAILV